MCDIILTLCNEEGASAREASADALLRECYAGALRSVREGGSALTWERQVNPAWPNAKAIGEDGSQILYPRGTILTLLFKIRTLV